MSLNSLCPLCVLCVSVVSSQLSNRSTENWSKTYLLNPGCPQRRAGICQGLEQRGAHPDSSPPEQ